MVNTEQSSVSSIRACPSWLRSQQWKTTELQSFQDMPGNVENASERVGVRQHVFILSLLRLRQIVEVNRG